MQSAASGPRPRIALLTAQTAIGLREIPQSAFLLLYLQANGMTPSGIAQVVSWAQVAGMAVAVLGGVLTTRLGSKWVYVIGLVLSIASSFVFSLTDVWFITAAWVIGGAGAALYNVGSSGYLTRIGQAGGFGTLTALYILSATVGGAVGHPIASWIITDVSYAGYGMSMLVLSLITIVIAVVGMPNLVDDTTTVRIPSRSMHELLRTSRVWAILVMRGLATVNYGAMLLLVPLLLDTLTNDPGLVAAYGSTSLVLASLAQFGAGRAADRWGAQWPTAMSFAVMVGGSLFLALAHTTVVGLFVGGVISIAAAWALATLMFIWVADGVPQRDHATLFGLLIAVWSISMIIGSLTAGRLVEIAPASPFVVVGVINALALLVGWRYYAGLKNTAAISPEPPTPQTP